MAKIKIEEMTFPNDKLLINDWHNELKDTSIYETIESYLDRCR
jgi:hypothetical protein